MQVRFRAQPPCRRQERSVRLNARSPPQKGIERILAVVEEGALLVHGNFAVGVRLFHQQAKRDQAGAGHGQNRNYVQIGQQLRLPQHLFVQAGVGHLLGVRGGGRQSGTMLEVALERAHGSGKVGVLRRHVHHDAVLMILRTPR